MAEIQTVELEHLKLEYYTYGSGPKSLLAFHGFGRHAKDFEVFEEVYGSEYTIYAFNLFHHGKSEYPEDRVDQNTFTKREFKVLFNRFFEIQGIHNTGIMGYSLGGKIALLFTEIFPQRIKSLWLFAPDGIKMNFWYFVASKTVVGRSVYRRILSNPAIFFSMVNGLHKTKIINDKLRKFAMNNMDDREKRELVYKVWLTFKNTNPNMKVVIENINRNEIPVYQFYGQNDKVIPPKLGTWFSRKIHQEDNFHILKTGHNLLTKKTADYIKDLNII